VLAVLCCGASVAGCGRVAPSPFSLPTSGPDYWGLSVEIKTVEPWSAVVLPMRGPYSQTADALRRVSDHLRSRGIATDRVRFGRYFSDPRDGREADLEWEVGLAVPEGTRVEAPFVLRSYPRETVASTILHGPFVENSRHWPEFLRTVVASGHQPIGPGQEIWRGSPLRAGAYGPQTELRVPVWRVPVAHRLTLYLVCLWGASLFALFVLLYLRQEHRRRFSRWGGYLWAAAAGGCLLFFLAPILRDLTYLYSGRALVPIWVWANALSLAALPLFMHLWYYLQRERLTTRWLFRSAVVAMYGIAALLAAGLAFDVFGVDWRGRLDALVCGLVAAIAAFGLVVDVSARGSPQGSLRRAERRTHRVLLAATCCAGLLGVVLPSGVAQELAFLSLRLVPLGFLLSAAYYNERALFFDVLVKRGVFLLALLVALMGYFVWVPGWLFSPRLGWLGVWVLPVSAAPLVAGAPWVFARLSSLIDRRWLGRPLTPPEAYRYFVAGLAAAETREGLRLAAAEGLSTIFQTHATVELGRGATSNEDGETTVVPLEGEDGAWGVIRVETGGGRRPLLSEDRRLLQTLAQAFTLAFENARLREKRLFQDQRERELTLNASRAELKALRAQINPHFLFNALNSIAALIARDPDRAEATVERLAEVFRYTLRRSDKEWVRVEEELAFAQCYLDVERTRFGARLEVSQRVDATAREALVLAMSVQTLVENAIKHGVATVRGVGRVEVRVRREGDRVRIEARDNGPGFPDHPRDRPSGQRHGLRNVRERLEGHFGSAASLTVRRDETDGMTVVAIETPFLLAPPSDGAGSS
jgi:anti-sigma regulatory factor (Ser/Thr protein kinase)